MPLSIKNPRAEELARAVARETRESITQAIICALEERLERLRGQRSAPDVAREIMRVSERCRALPDLDTPHGLTGCASAFREWVRVVQVSHIRGVRGYMRCYR